MPCRHGGRERGRGGWTRATRKKGEQEGGRLVEGNKQSGRSSQQPVWGTQLLVKSVSVDCSNSSSVLLHLSGINSLLSSVGGLSSGIWGLQTQLVFMWTRLSGTRAVTSWEAGSADGAAGLHHLLLIFLQKEQHAYLTVVLHQQVGVIAEMHFSAIACMSVGSGCVLCWHLCLLSHAHNRLSMRCLCVLSPVYGLRYL